MHVIYAFTRISEHGVFIDRYTWLLYMYIYSCRYITHIISVFLLILEKNAQKCR